MLRYAILEILICACVGVSACKRAPAPPAGPPAAKLSMAPEAPAEAEVTASSGPVKLTLRVYKTRITKGKSLWLQVIFTNVGDKPTMISNEYISLLPTRLWKDFGLGILMTDASGKTAELASLKEDLPLGCMSQEERAPWMAFAHSTGTSQAGGHRDTWLDPGESVASIPYAYQSSMDKYCARLPEPKPILPFAEFAETRGLPAGKYRVFAVYNVLLAPPLHNHPDNVKFETPPVSFEVAP